MKEIVNVVMEGYVPYEIPKKNPVSESYITKHENVKKDKCTREAEINCTTRNIYKVIYSICSVQLNKFLRLGRRVCRAQMVILNCPPERKVLISLMHKYLFFVKRKTRVIFGERGVIFGGM